MLVKNQTPSGTPLLSPSTRIPKKERMKKNKRLTTRPPKVKMLRPRAMPREKLSILNQRDIREMDLTEGIWWKMI